MSAGYLHKCGRKRQHETQEAAERHRRSLVAQGIWTMTGSNTYACNVCGHFHAGRVGGIPRGRSKQPKTRKAYPTQ